MTANKQFIPTFTIEDANFFCRKKAERLEAHADFGFRILEDSSRQSDRVAALHRDGVLVLSQFLDVDKIRHLGEAVDGLIDKRMHLGSPRHHRRELDEGRMLGDFLYLPGDRLADYDIAKETTGVNIKQPLICIPDILDTVLHDRLLSLAIAYYQALPQLTFVKVRKSFVNDIPEADTHLWHADIGSYRILKFLIYLNDVDYEGGPFEYVRGSHNRVFNGWRNDDYKLRYTDEELRDAYGAENMVSCMANMGDVVIADTTGFHRGLKPISNASTVAIATFCIHPERGFDYPKMKIQSQMLERLSPVQRAVVDDLEVVN
jgi:hypothetical protein